jgi:hypothetical protein
MDTQNLSDWNLIFLYENALKEYFKHYKFTLKQKSIKDVEIYRKEILKRMGW